MSPYLLLKNVQSPELTKRIQNNIDAWIESSGLIGSQISIDVTA
jgi:hypothetical protein